MSTLFNRLTLLAALGLSLPSMALAGGKAEVRKQVESSMLVKGQLDIEQDGRVSAVALDGEDKLPAGVIKLVTQAAHGWKFDPASIDHQRVRSPMNVRVVARQLDNGDYEVALRGASFRRYDVNDAAAVTSDKMTPPRYPVEAFSRGASGTVYLLVKVGAKGTVEEVVAEQVNLTFIDNERSMERFRKLFSENATAAARRWTFKPPTQGPQADKPFWVARVPVRYSLSDTTKPSADDPYGRWVAYVPGPRQRAPWREEVDEIGFSPDALGDSGVYLADAAAPRLLTPLQGG